jgi:hypothetical protein
MRLLAATAFLSLSIAACGAQRAAMEVSGDPDAEPGTSWNPAGKP